MPSSKFLEAFEQVAASHPDEVAYFTSRPGEAVSYGELSRASNALAAFLHAEAPAGLPVVVYGHKSPLMLTSFLAAAKAGLPYAPVDVAYPADRVADILDQIGRPLVLDLSDDGLPCDPSLANRVLRADDVRTALAKDASCDPAWRVSGDDIFYLLFTSGSTGRPKGVMMPSRCVDAFMAYFQRLFPKGDHRVSFNRVPYTFDVSLFDIIAGLSQGYALFALETECEQSMAATFAALEKSGLAEWVSTPSFIEMCLADPSFAPELLPSLDTIVLCGEVLRNGTAEKILNRFPGVALYNTYGPTETQAVTDILVTRELCESANPLPVGFLNPEVRAVIRDLETGEELPAGETGEVYLEGATVSLGYWKRPDLTEAAFAPCVAPDGSPSRIYKTGDKGYVDAEGRLFCLGRLDFQVKLNGFRVELGDVEQALATLDAVKEAVVLPAERDGKVTHLVAHLLPSDPDAPRDFKAGQTVKAALRHTLPDYMIPKKIVFHDAFPLNVNGKIDRKALAAK